MATINNSGVTVGSSSTEVSTAKTRVWMILTNDSNQAIYLGVGAAAVVNRGIALMPGEKFIADKQDTFNESIYAICQSGDANLCLFEASI